MTRSKVTRQPYIRLQLEKHKLQGKAGRIVNHVAASLPFISFTELPPATGWRNPNIMGTPASIVCDFPQHPTPNSCTRKRASANIFQGVELLQLRRLFHSSGDAQAEERAQLVWERAGNRCIAQALRQLHRRQRKRRLRSHLRSPSETDSGTRLIELQHFSHLRYGFYVHSSRLLLKYSILQPTISIVLAPPAWSKANLSPLFTMSPDSSCLTLKHMVQPVSQQTLDQQLHVCCQYPTVCTMSTNGMCWIALPRWTHLEHLQLISLFINYYGSTDFIYYVHVWNLVLGIGFKQAQLSVILTLGKVRGLSGGDGYNVITKARKEQN